MLILVFGLPASGKTYFSKHLAAAFDAVHLNTDHVRKELGKQGDYDPATKQMIYDAMLEKALVLLQQERHVILDGTFHKKIRRKDVENIAGETNKRLYFIQLMAREDTVRQRLKQRRQFSEADLKVYQQVKMEFEPCFREHLELWTDEENIDLLIRKAKEYINGTEAD